MRVRLERRVDTLVGIAMLTSRTAMGFLAVIEFIAQSEKGNVIPALTIASLGVVSNGVLAANYSIACAKTSNEVLKAQRALYLTKVGVNICVCIALTVIIMLSGRAEFIADFAGGLVVALVLIANGFKLILSRRGKRFKESLNDNSDSKPIDKWYS